jgi:hypothetical protein
MKFIKTPSCLEVFFSSGRNTGELLVYVSVSEQNKNMYIT